MAEKIESIISNAEIERVHANANFGNQPKREVVNEGVLKFAFGFGSGHTQMVILREHGLITKPRGYKAALTEKGKRYARALAGPYFHQLVEIMKPQPGDRAALQARGDKL